MSNTWKGFKDLIVFDKKKEDELVTERIQNFIEDNIETINQFEHSKGAQHTVDEFDDLEDLDFDDQNEDLFASASKVKVDLADMDYQSRRK